MSEQQIKAKFDAIREKLTIIENEVQICKRILKGEKP